MKFIIYKVYKNYINITLITHTFLNIYEYTFIIKLDFFHKTVSYTRSNVAH